MSSLFMASASRPSSPTWRIGAHPAADVERVALVGDDLGWRVLHAPGREQRLERRARRGAEARRACRRGEDLCDGIQEDQRAAAAQHELIDRVERGLSSSAGCTTHSTSTSSSMRNVLAGSARMSNSCFACSTMTHGWLGCCVCGSKPPLYRGAREQADDDLVGIGEVVDEPREIVLEESLLGRIGLEERNRVRAADAVRAREAEVHGFAARTDVRGLQAVLLRAVLLLRERQRIDYVQNQAPFRR